MSIWHNALRRSGQVKGLGYARVEQAAEMIRHGSIAKVNGSWDVSRQRFDIEVEAIDDCIAERTWIASRGPRICDRTECTPEKVCERGSRGVGRNVSSSCGSSAERQQNLLSVALTSLDIRLYARTRIEELRSLATRCSIVCAATGVRKIRPRKTIASCLIWKDIYESNWDDIDCIVVAEVGQGLLIVALSL